MSKVYCKWKGT